MSPTVAMRRGMSGLLLLALLLGSPRAGQAQSTSITFPQTGQTVSDPFLAYWQAHGGLAQFGYPISSLIAEVSPLDGQLYTVQYFERAVFEFHPQNAAPNDVLLSQLGTFRYRQLYPAGAPAQQASTDHPQFFAPTGHTVGGLFGAYWQAHGGLSQQGYPLSDEFTELSPIDGKVYRVQYFERAVFEYHPENAGTAAAVLLTPLGSLRYRQQYPTAGQTPAPAPTVVGAPPLPPIPTPGPVANCAALPPAQNMAVSPQCAPQGTVFYFTGTGFPANEQVAVYYTWPDGLIQNATGYTAADGAGSVAGVTFTTQTDTSTGIWAVTMEGLQSHTRAVGYFQVMFQAPATPVSVAGGCDTSGNIDGQATPSSAKIGDTIQITASGFTHNEPVAAWFTNPLGTPVRTANIDRSLVGQDGTIGPLPLYTGTGAFGTEPGRWAYTLHGLISNHESVLYFCLTR